MVHECPRGINFFSNSSTANATKAALLQLGHTYGGLVHGYLASGLCIFGIIANVVNIVVLSRPIMLKSSVNVILRAIAFCDLAIMVMYQIYVTHFVLMADRKDCWLVTYTKFWSLFLWAYVYVSVWLHVTGLWLAVSMALMRFMTLRKVQPWSKWQNPRYARTLSYLILFGVSVCSIIVGVCYEVRPYQKYRIDSAAKKCLTNLTIPSDNSTGPIIQSYMLESAFRALANDCFLQRINLWTIGLVFKIIPCFLLAILSFGLLFQLKKATKQSKRMSQRHQSENKMLIRKWRKMDKTNSLLVLILVISLLTQFPQGILHILDAIYDDVNAHIYKNVGDIIDLLSLLNSSLNFVLYCIMSSQYRKTLYVTLKSRCKK